MQKRAIHSYVTLVTAAAVITLFLQDWGQITGLPGRAMIGLAALLLLGVLSESFALSITIGKSSGTSSITYLPLLTCILLFGGTPTVLFMGVTGVIGEFLIRKKELIRAVFNSSQYIFAAAVGGFVFSTSGGRALALSTQSFSVGLAGQLLSFLLFGVVFLALNHAAVATAIALNQGMPLRKVGPLLVGRTGTNLFYDILVSPIAIAVAFLYMELWVIGLVLVLLPLFFIRYSYSTILELQKANRDILTALVKAIETRDPYTSGHSLRVASLALRIGEELGLSQRRLRDLETAALLHDIGKIDSVYSEILAKPDHLTSREREVIESHVDKGVELLQQLSSFSEDVVAAVRGHHERVDGRGYPQGLSGDEIPISARIIKVCDAIDAMLSDRPYRLALTLEQVREQLVIYASTQFDLTVVNAAIRADLLEAHQAEIMLRKAESGVGTQRDHQLTPKGKVS